MDWGSIFELSLRELIGVQAIVFALAAIGINVQFGYTGLLNFGQAAFAAVGGYGVAVIVTTYDGSFWLGILVSISAAVVLALLLGIPTLRLRADYLAIVTIAASEIVRLVGRSAWGRDVFGGSDGITGFSNTFYDLNPFTEPFQLGPFEFRERVLWVLVVGWALVAVCTLVVWLLMRSPWGRVLKGIREDEDAVRSLGKNVYAYKMQSLVLGGVIGAFAGIVYSLFQGAMQPDVYATNFTFFAYAILILGGAATVFGPVLGAAIVWFAFQFIDLALRGAITEGYIPDWLMDSTDTGAVRFMLTGIVLVLLLVFRPQGILGDRREIALDAR
ncbi:branched-chain amino acid ABC transporter permease [Jiangella alkaliphila]|uniref:Amino acid/amide ABC transporter membrane protein 2, HAAT family n=1 Tax=Jiangella alkaliphila TaxID=419479 RepID=A0A1H2L3X4_9ACTN|nr:branched-chain amino acid ABC transporter permease [Jiangella alkaliphila]SDU75258.1 amino acid/amide ABC transporter membrane protein 2, HAAT family [Jiangella alkaliphila]